MKVHTFPDLTGLFAEFVDSCGICYPQLNDFSKMSGERLFSTENGLRSYLVNNVESMNNIHCAWVLWVEKHHISEKFL